MNNILAGIIGGIRKRVEATTWGDWEWQLGRYEQRYTAIYAIDPEDIDEVIGTVLEETVAGILFENDADRVFIARARADVLLLLTLVDELSAENARLRRHEIAASDTINAAHGE